jgi:hypothetical protein
MHPDDQARSTATSAGPPDSSRRSHLTAKGSRSACAPPCVAFMDEPGMERLWSRGGATGGNRSQMGKPRKRLEQAKTVAVGCDRLPIGAHKEGSTVRVRQRASQPDPRSIATTGHGLRPPSRRRLPGVQEGDHGHLRMILRRRPICRKKSMGPRFASFGAAMTRLLGFFLLAGTRSTATTGA